MAARGRNIRRANRRVEAQRNSQGSPPDAPGDQSSSATALPQPLSRQGNSRQKRKHPDHDAVPPSDTGPQLPQAAPATAKPPPRGRGPARKKNKVALHGPGQDSGAAAPTLFPSLEPFSIDLNPRTRNCNAWDKTREKLTAEHVEYTLAKLLPTDIDDMPVYDDRKMIVDHIDLVTSPRLAPDPITGQLPLVGTSGKHSDIDFSKAEQIQHRVIHIRDSNKPGSPHLILYDAHVSMQKRTAQVSTQRRDVPMRPGALTVDICPTEADARRVALDVCKKLERVPMSLERFNDLGNTKVILPMKRMIECLSLRALRPDFSYSELHPEWTELHGEDINNREMNFFPTVMGHASLEHTTTVARTTNVRMSFRACTATGYSYLIRFYLHHYDKEKLKGIEDLIPEWFFAKCETWTGMLTDVKTQKYYQTTLSKKTKRTDDKADDEADDEPTAGPSNEADDNNPIDEEHTADPADAADGNNPAGDEPVGPKKLNKSKRNATLEDMGLSEDDWILYRGLARYMQYKVWGCVGDVSQSQVVTNHIGVVFEKADAKRHLVVEIADGKPPWGVTSVSNSMTTTTVITPMKIATAAVKGGKLTRIAFAGHSKIIIAYVQEQMMKTLARRKGLPNAWTEGCEAADVVDNYMPALLSKAKIIEEYCQCKDDTERRQTNHYDMLDLNVYRCIDMVELEDGRRVCKYNAENFGTEASDYHSNRTLNALLNKISYGASSDEARLVEKPVDATFTQAIAVKCKEFMVPDSKDQWRDGYCSNKICSMQDAEYPIDMPHRHVAGAHRRPPHPRQPSLEAARPYIRVDGATHVHHPDNILVTAFCINMLKGAHIAAILPWFRLAVENWTKEKGGEPRNERFWRAFHAAMDHAMIIRKETPYSRKNRRKYKPTESTYQEHQRQWKSGRSSHSVLSRRHLGTIASSPHGRNIRKGAKQAARDVREALYGRTESVPWTAEDRKRLLFLHDLIWRNSEWFKKGGLKMPCGNDGVLWPYRADHMPDDLDWDWLYEEMLRRLWRLDDLCDAESVTEESPDTLLIDLICQWYDTDGGKNQQFGCEMTPFTRHPCTVSIGRDVHVDPGSPMRTRCRVLKSATLADLDLSRRTLTFEPQSINMFKSSFPKEVLPGLENVLLDLAMSSEFWDAPDLDIPSLTFPDQLPQWRAFGRDGGWKLRSDATAEDAPGSLSDDDLEDDLENNINIIVHEDTVYADDDATDILAGVIGRTGKPGSGLIGKNARGWRKPLSEAERRRQQRRTMESDLHGQSTLTIWSGEQSSPDWSRVFVQQGVSGESFRCMWLAVAISCVGEQDGWIDVYARTLQLWNAVMHSPVGLTNHARDARKELYGKLADNNAEFVTNMTSAAAPVWGEADTAQVVADALDIQIWMYTPYLPQDDSEMPDAPTVGAWEIQVRGHNPDPERHIHLCNYPDMNHWTAIAPAQAADIGGEYPEVTEYARQSVFDISDNAAGPIPRLPVGHPSNTDLRPSTRLAQGRLFDGHVADCELRLEVFAPNTQGVMGLDPITEEMDTNMDELYAIMGELSAASATQTDPLSSQFHQ